MKIESVTLHELRMRLKVPFATSFGVMANRRFILIEVKADGVTGWGEVTTLESPLYNAETTGTAWDILSNFILPRVLGKQFERASELPSALSAIRGHEMAKAGVENAVWNIESQQKNVALWKLLHGTRQEIPCGVSLGIRESPTALVKAVEEELRRGYQRIKLKIMPGKDLDFIHAVRQEFPQTQLSVDANSAYSLSDAPHLRKLDEFRLLMIEQPLEWDDIFAHAKLQPELRTPICLDECIHNSRHAKSAIELGACRIINIKLGRVGGYTEALRVHDVSRENAIPVWCGGMLESGVGRAHNIALSTLPGFTLPGDVSASCRYWDEDIIAPPVEVTSSGTIRAPDTPGLGFAVKRDLVNRLAVRQQTFLN